MENDYLGGDMPKNKILEYFIAEKRTNVSPDDIQKATKLEKECIQEELDKLFKQDILNNRQPNMYGLNLKNPAVEKILKNYFLGGIKKIEQDYRGKKLSCAEARTSVNLLDDRLIKLQEESGMPDWWRRI